MYTGMGDNRKRRARGWWREIVQSRLDYIHRESRMPFLPDSDDGITGARTLTESIRHHVARSCTIALKYLSIKSVLWRDAYMLYKDYS